MPFLMTAYPTFDYFSTKRSLGVNLYITPLIYPYIYVKVLHIAASFFKMHDRCSVLSVVGRDVIICSKSS